MPLPTPNNKEKKSEFVARCMADSIMNKDFKDEKQRAAVCYAQFEKKSNKSKANIQFDDGDEMLFE